MLDGQETQREIRHNRCAIESIVRKCRAMTIFVKNLFFSKKTCIFLTFVVFQKLNGQPSETKDPLTKVYIVPFKMTFLPYPGIHSNEHSYPIKTGKQNWSCVSILAANKTQNRLQHMLGIQNKVSKNASAVGSSGCGNNRA